MARGFDLTRQRHKERQRQVKSYGTETPLSSAAVERGSTRWLNGSKVVIEGLLDVAGTATVGGTLSVTGTFNGSGVNNLDGTNNLSGDNNLTGPTEISGSLDVTGPTSLDGVLTINGDTSITGLLSIEGDSTISGKLDIEGKTTVAADLELVSGGKFIAGETTIEPSGKATFGDVVIDPASIYLIQTPGGWVSGTGADDITLASSLSSSVSLNGSRAELDYKGVKVTARAGAIDLNAPVVHASGRYLVNNGVGAAGVEVSATRLKIGNLPTTSVGTSNVHADSNGIFYRVTNP